MSARGKPAPRLLCHYEDADGHVVEAAQVSEAREGTEFWGEMGSPHVPLLARATRYSPCRVGLTVRIHHLRPQRASEAQRNEIAFEVPCTFDSDGEYVGGRCYDCGRLAPPGTPLVDEDAAYEGELAREVGG